MLASYANRALSAAHILTAAAGIPTDHVKTVLIYDDVCTTGTQLDAVAGCLLDRVCAARIEAVVLARTWRDGAQLAG